MIRVVAPFMIFLATSAIWSDRLPLLFIISPRYLYEGTSSSTSPLSFRVLFLPFPFLTTLHLAAPNWIWYLFATWFVTSSISCSFCRPWWIRHTSSPGHHPSIAASPGCSSVVFLFRGFFSGVLWLFHPWGLHTLLLIVLPLSVLCCPWCWFSWLVLTWFVSWQLDWSLSFLSFSDFCHGLRSCVGYIWLRPAMLCHRPFVHPGRLCTLCVPFLVFLG